MNKPDWWPQNPYPESIFPTTLDKYKEIVPDPQTRTALSGTLGREFWQIAEEIIWRALQNHLEEMEAENAELTAELEKLKKETNTK